ncbi:MAG: hypothetical protein ACXWL5_04125 [Candidatus Chromulinivorax sp.]
MKKSIYFILVSSVFLHTIFLLSGDKSEAFNNWVLKNKGNPWQALQAMQDHNIDSAAIEYGQDYIKDLNHQLITIRALQTEGCLDETKGNEFIQKIQDKTLNIDGIRNLNSEIEKANNLLKIVDATKNTLLENNKNNLKNARSEALANKYNRNGTKESETVFAIIFQQLDEQIKNQASESKSEF